MALEAWFGVTRRSSILYQSFHCLLLLGGWDSSWYPESSLSCRLSPTLLLLSMVIARSSASIVRCCCSVLIQSVSVAIQMHNARPSENTTTRSDPWAVSAWVGLCSWCAWCSCAADPRAASCIVALFDAQHCATDARSFLSMGVLGGMARITGCHCNHSAQRRRSLST